MCASPLNFLRNGPPPPRAVLLPDGLFFVRAVPVPPAAERAEVAAQAELALEASAPFPLDQLYHGYFWSPGSDRALVYAAYRRRFTAEQQAAWKDAELVLPHFAALLGAAVGPATTAVLSGPDGLTAIHWEQGAVPSRVAFQSLAAEATEGERAAAREGLLRRFESKTIVDLAAAPVPEPSRNDSEVVFHSDHFTSRLPAETAAALDVRAKEDLAALRGLRRRDLLLWHVGMGCLAACLLLILGEIGLVAGGLWQKGRQTTVDAQAPVVENIKTADGLAHRIDALYRKRLLPLEMITAIVGVKGETKPASITFLNASAGTASGLYTLTIEAQASNAGEIGSYQTTLSALPTVAKAEVSHPLYRNNVTTFTLVVTFKPLALKQTPPPPAS